MRSSEREIRGDLTAFAGGSVADGPDPIGGVPRQAPNPHSSLSLLAPFICQYVQSRPSDRFSVPLLRVINDAGRSFRRPSHARKEVRERVNR